MVQTIIAEDDPVAGKILSIMLSNMNAEVTQVTDGQSLLTHVQKQSFQLAFVDYRLPDLKATEILRTLKNIRPKLPVVIQSAHVSSNMREELIREGADEIIEKPVSKNQIAALLRKYTVAE